MFRKVTEKERSELYDFHFDEIRSEEEVVAVPATIGCMTSLKEMLMLEIEVDEINCPFMENNNDWPTDADKGPGRHIPCISFSQDDRSPASKFQCPYFMKILDYKNIEIMCRGNLKKGGGGIEHIVGRMCYGGLLTEGVPDSVRFEMHQSECPHPDDNDQDDLLDHFACLWFGEGGDFRCKHCGDIDVDSDENKYTCRCK